MKSGYELVFLGMAGWLGLHSCGSGPIKSDSQYQDEALDAIGMLKLGFGDAESSGFEIGEQGLDAPTHAIVEHAPFGGRLRHGDDPGLAVAFLMENADRGGDAAFASAGVMQRRHARLRR